MPTAAPFRPVLSLLFLTRRGTRAASSTAAHSPFTSRVTPNLTLSRGKDVSSGIAGRRGTTVAVNPQRLVPSPERFAHAPHNATRSEAISTLLRNREEINMKEDLIKGRNLSARLFFVEPNS